MVIRISDDSESDVVSQEKGFPYKYDGAAHRNITAEIIDRAIEDTFRDTAIPAETQAVMRNMLAMDSTSAVAQTYFQGMTAAGAVGNRPITRRQKLNIPYVLSEEEVSILADYAPDFDLRFFDGDNHDHPLAAASRLIDRKVVADRIPAGMTTSDLGGSIVPLIMSGELGKRVHTCAPILDVKDPSRRTLAHLRAKAIERDVKYSDAIRASARAYLNQDVAAICNCRAQDCHYKVKAITSIHVYDIPIGDWGQIMTNHGASLAEGCLLFPEGIFSASEGKMRSAGARYECDALSNEFRMGFVGSPSWWYRHRLSDYLKYGVDQILRYQGNTYSYKIVERRGDTIFFRILQTGMSVSANYDQYYRVPGIPMVMIDGFEISTRKVDLAIGRRAKYMFPALLWNDLLGFAKDMVERGTLSHERLFNYYRTVAPRQSINSVIVSGGTEVDSLNDLLPLILHVALFALMETARSKSESTAITAANMEARLRADESTWWKLGVTLGEAVMTSFKVFFFPFLVMTQFANNKVETALLRDSHEWCARPEYVNVSAKLVLAQCFIGDNSVTAEDFMIDYAERVAPLSMVETCAGDAELSEIMLKLFDDALPSNVVAGLKKTVEARKKELEEDDVSTPVSNTTLIPPSPVDVSVRNSNNAVSGVVPLSANPMVSSEEVERRYDSIKEAILECEAESAKNEAACATQYLEAMSGGAPNLRVLKEHNEMFGNPEFWYLENGVISKSLTGLALNEFQHAAIYIPVVSDGSRLYRVVEEEFKGMSGGEYVERVHFRVDLQYTGWAYTNDSLIIYNGPDIVEAMHLAMNKPMDFEVKLCQGPPGCGKTTSIIEKATADDVILVPVRKAARETAERIVKSRGKSFRVMAKTRIRTLDSYLVNYRHNPKLTKMVARRLLADEAFMAREGRWFAAAALLGVGTVLAFGDQNQIPHVPRAECPKSYVSIKYQTIEQTFVSYRCPAQLVACWNSVFDNKVRSMSKEEGVVKHVTSSSKQTIPTGCVMMGMYQADKKLLQEKYGGCGVKIHIMTVHESQGNTYEHVWLHRFDLRKRNDKFSLYDKEAYALVAMSRSTKSFVYIAPKTLDDCITRWIVAGSDVRRINAAKDTTTAGQSVEFL